MNEERVQGSTGIAAVIAVYNGEKEIRRSVESVLAQTQPPDEFIVVDDGSTDRTGEIVQSYGPRVRYLYQKNSGVSTARNRGVKEAQSEWVAFLDHDDEWLPNKLEKQAAAVAADPGASLCYSGIEVRDRDGICPGVHFISLDRIWPGARLRNPFPPSVVMIRRSVFLELGGFHEELKKAGVEDWEFFARFLATHRAVAVAEPLARYYEVPESASRKNHRKMLADSLAIVDRGLLTGLTGARRMVWRRRIRGVVYYRAALFARDEREPAAGYLLHSFLEWPFPGEAPRWRTAAAWLIRRAKSAGTHTAAQRDGPDGTRNG
jgi:glycosyltransferase involved in cell wall biosynthesis